MNQETQIPMENQGEEEVVFYGEDGRRLRSIVWKYYERVKKDGIVKAKCKACKKELVAKGGSGTSHLGKHVERYFKVPNKLDVKQLLLQSRPNKGGDSTLTMGKFKFSSQVSRNELSNMIVLHEYPLAMVDHIGFRRYSASLNPDFKVVTRNTVKADIFKAYMEEKSSLMRMLATNESRIAITTDMWTCNNQKKGYMAVTAHFVDDDWILFIFVSCPHNAETLSKTLISSLKSFDLDEKVSTITVDNCTTNDVMMDILLEKLNPGKLVLNGSHLHMRCCAHILNLVVSDGLELIGQAIEKVRDVVSYCLSTPSRTEKFEDACNYCKIPLTKKLVLDCKTRWNSCYEMLQVALLYKDAFARLETKVCKKGKSKFVLPKRQEWQMASDICERLALFKRASDAFSGQDYPTANLYFQKICEIRLALRKWLTCGNKVIESMASVMVMKFDKYWSDVNGILSVASVVDSRRKLEFVSFYFGHLYGDEHDDECDRIKQLLLDLVADYEQKYFDIDVAEQSVSEPSSSINDRGKRPMVDLDDVEDLWEKHVSKKPRNKVRRCEVEIYLGEDRIIVDDNKFNLLAWWNAESSKYPTLSKVARDLLAVPISTVASESAFSAGGRVVGPHRSRLFPDTVEALMCLQSWRRPQFKDSTKDYLQLAPIFDDEDVNVEEE